MRQLPTIPPEIDREAAACPQRVDSTTLPCFGKSGKKTQLAFGILQQHFGSAGNPAEVLTWKGGFDVK